jgi:hypothetical protein
MQPHRHSAVSPDTVVATPNRSTLRRKSSFDPVGETGGETQANPQSPASSITAHSSQRRSNLSQLESNSIIATWYVAEGVESNPSITGGRLFSSKLHNLELQTRAQPQPSRAVHGGGGGH